MFSTLAYRIAVKNDNEKKLNYMIERFDTKYTFRMDDIDFLSANIIDFNNSLRSDITIVGYKNKDFGFERCLLKALSIGKTKRRW